MKKTILIPGYAGKDSNNFGVGVNYLNLASHFGNVRILMPHDEFVEGDMLLIPGGMDMNPAHYGEVPHFSAGNIDVHKQFFFEQRLKNYIGKTNIVGICLGAQELAVYFGSKLCQHLYYHSQSKSRWEEAHYIYPPSSFENGFLKQKASKNPENFGGIKVNSHHHQAVLLSTISSDLTPLYLAEYEDKFMPGRKFKDAIVEVFKHNTLPILGIQSHVEEGYDYTLMGIISNLINNKELIEDGVAELT